MESGCSSADEPIFYLSLVLKETWRRWKEEETVYYQSVNSLAVPRIAGQTKG